MEWKAYHIEHGFRSLWHLSHAQDARAVPSTSLKQLLQAIFMVVAFYWMASIRESCSSPKAEVVKHTKLIVLTRSIGHAFIMSVADVHSLNLCNKSIERSLVALITFGER